MNYQDEFKKFAVRHMGMSSMHLEKYMQESARILRDLPLPSLKKGS